MANEKKSLGVVVDYSALIELLKKSDTEDAKNAVIVIEHQGAQILVLTQNLAEVQAAIKSQEELHLAALKRGQEEISRLQDEYAKLEEELEGKDEEVEQYKGLLEEAIEKLKSFPQVAIADDSFEVDGKTYKLLYPSFQHGGEVIDISVLKKNARIAREVLDYGTLTKEV